MNNEVKSCSLNSDQEDSAMMMAQLPVVQLALRILAFFISLAAELAAGIFAKVFGTGQACVKQRKRARTIAFMHTYS